MTRNKICFFVAASYLVCRTVTAVETLFYPFSALYFVLMYVYIYVCICECDLFRSYWVEENTKTRDLGVLANNNLREQFPDNTGLYREA